MFLAYACFEHLAKQIVDVPLVSMNLKWVIENGY
jgi:hypothetical protein